MGLNSKNVVHNKIAVIIFSAIALLFGAASDLVGLVYNLIDSIDNLTKSLVWIYIVDSIMGIVGVLFTIATCVLLVVYVLFFSKKSNGRFLLAAVFVLLMYPILKYGIGYLISSWYISTYSNQLDLLTFIKSFFSFPIVSLFFIKLPLLIAAVLVIIGVRKNIFYILPLAISVCSIISETRDYIDTFMRVIVRTDSYYDSTLTTIIRILYIISGFAIHVAVLLFVCENTSFFAKSKKIEQDKNTENMSSTDAIMYLRERLDNGDITAEEYQTQREIILNKI